MEQLTLIGLSKSIHSIAIEMYFSNGEVKSCYENDMGFKINNELSEPLVTINGYKDKQVWNNSEMTTDGKDFSEIESCFIEANKKTVESYMHKLGVFSESVPVNRKLINDILQSNIESTVSSLASSISMLENQITMLVKTQHEPEMA